VLTLNIVIKIKKELIHKAKVKKTYAKIKSRDPPIDTPVRADEPGEARLQPAEPSQEIHPERQAMLDAPADRVSPTRQKDQPQLERKRGRRPTYFEKETAFAEQQKAEAEAKRAEFERRNKERREKIAERGRFRKSMAKARTGGRNGQRKLGRESKVLLERVKRIVES